MKPFRQATALALAGWVTFSVCANAAVPLIPFEELVRQPLIGAIVLSPSNSEAVGIETIDGRAAIVRFDLTTGTRRLLYRNPERSIDNIAWSGDGKWLYFLQDAGGDEGYHLYRLDPAHPGPPTDMTPFEGIAVELIRTPGSAAGDVLITLNKRDPQFADAFSLDLGAGALTELVRNDRGFTEFFGDHNGRILAATAIRDDGSIELHAKAKPSGEWSLIYVAKADERFKMLSLARNGDSAIIKSDRAGDRERLLTIDLVTAALKTITKIDCGEYDVTDGIVGPEGLLGAVCIRETAGFALLEPSLKRAVRAAAKLAGPGAGVSLESRSPGTGAAIFYADASDRPGRYIYVDKGKARVLAESRPWLRGAQFAKTKAVRIAARDGLPLLTYVTRPIGQQGPGPAIFAIHGGPWSRDLGGFEGETQLLANRGYTVLQVNFRGSAGLGKQVFEGGIREFGRKMSDDIDDVYHWAVERRLIDAERTCLLGGSYGGYAVLMGLARGDPSYKCGVDYAGPVDLVTLVEGFPPSWKPFLPRSWYRFVGDPSKPVDRAEMTTNSPLRRADAISAPMLIFQGANDPRVTQVQSDSIVCSLRSRGILADYLLAAGEGHSFGNEEIGLAVNRAVELFLAEHLGGRRQEDVPARVSEALSTLRAAGESISCPQ